MQKKQFIEIATKISENMASEQEMALFLFHINRYNLESSAWENVDPKVKAVIKDAVADKILTTIQQNPVGPAEVVKIRPIWSRIAVAASRRKFGTSLVAAAAAIAMVVFGLWFFRAPRLSDPSLRAQRSNLNDIAPGTVGATLTLASGKKIRLSDAANGELAKEAGVMITKSSDGQLVYEIMGSDADPNKINTLSTANGETYKLRLPDGSLVVLNAASSLTYSANLIENGQRRVKLQGEGYFEIFKDKKHPFIVQTDKQEVEVLGTHFNINSYADEGETKTTLLEGSIRLSSLRGGTTTRALGESSEANQPHIDYPDEVASSRRASRNDGQGGAAVTLRPNQQATLTATNAIQVKQIDPALAVAWKNGEFTFNDESLESIMRKLARWYDVEVVYENIDKNKPFGGSISRFENISKVLEKLELTGSVHFKIEGRRVTVSK